MQSGHLLADRYELISHIARGGMADVWEAQDRALNRRVAVKVLHPQFSSDDSFVKRFRREAQAAANLSHPNVVSIFDWGQEGRTYFIVMELIEGRSLRDVLRSEGALLPRRATEIAAEVASALAVAHQAGLVHRDVKPGNILLTTDGTVKVTDFGIARAWDDSAELTRTGAVIGTATYFSPEQAQGESADARSDLYSLGIVLYEMLVGAPPFKGDSPVAVAYQHVSSAVNPPRSANPDITPALESITMRALQKFPQDRYQTSTDLRADLLASLRGEELQRPHPVPVQSEAPTRVLSGVTMAPPTVAPSEAYREVEEDPPSQVPFILTAFAMLAVLVFGVWLLFQGLGTGGGGDVAEFNTVPIVVNMTENQALAEVDNAGFQAQIDRRNHATVEAGIVIDTSPGGGTRLQAGSVVTVIVSAGTATAVVPPVEGLSEADARRAIEGATLTVASPVTPVPHASIPEGSATGTNPAAGQTLPVGGAVELFVSTGPGTYLLENFTGVLFQTVQFRLTSASIEVLRVDEFSDEFEADFVIRTEPTVGEIQVGSTVTVFVSKGAEPRDVPSLIGMTDIEAAAVLDELGLLLSVSDATIEDEALAGRIAQQIPAAGQQAQPGDTVTVIMAVASTTTTTVPETSTTTSTTTTTTTTTP